MAEHKGPTGAKRSEDCAADQPDDKDRREVLKRMGKYAAYTPPVILTLLVNDKKVAIAAPTPPLVP
jgi:hypothetical protein